MALVLLGLLILTVAGLSWASARGGQPAHGCCAQADPRDDPRMRCAFVGAADLQDRAPE
jgi:hypothetical protein